jgi:hypothetical protein
MGGRSLTTACTCLSKLKIGGEMGSGELVTHARKSQPKITSANQGTEQRRQAMKVKKVSINNKRKEFSVDTYSGTAYTFPYAEADPRPDTSNRIEEVFIDKELGNEAITYVLNSGDEGSIHMEQILEYNQDPNYMADLLTYKLTLEARQEIENSGLSRRQIAKRLKTSVPQLYRLLDPANTSKSINQLVALLHILNCKVDLVVNYRIGERAPIT